MGGGDRDGEAIGAPLWRAAGRDVAFQPLEGRAEADVVVVGGGVAGLSTALNLRRLGVDVVLLDAVRAHDDGACASAGIVAPQLVRNTPRSVVARLGRDRGGALLGMVAESGRYLFETVRVERIACAAARSGFLAPTMARTGHERLARIVEEWRPWRSDLSILSGAEVRERSGCAGYVAALLDESGGGIDPAALVDGLDAAAIGVGARVHRGAPVLRVERGRAGWSVATSGGSVDARRVVLCANGGNAALHPTLKGTTLPLPVIEVATRPLPPEMQAAILPGGETLTDLSNDVFSLRQDAEGRLITALAVSGATRTRTEIGEAVQARLTAMLPGYRPVPLEHVWQGTAWLNTSFLPRVVPIEDGLVAVQACNGRGLANNMIVGRELARWLHRPDHVPMVPFQRPRRVPGFAVMRHLPRLMMAGSGVARGMFRRARNGGGENGA